MKLLLIADNEEKYLWDDWNQNTRKKLSDVDLILSAGDLNANYLEFLVTMLNVPLVYVRGNHDGNYDKKPPEGCIDADGDIVEVACGKGAAKEKIRILGLGGSMKYKDYSDDMYTEEEMAWRIARLNKVFLRERLKGKTGFDILLTHAPCKGYGDMEDIAHTGFDCFNRLLDKYRPKLHVYGHVHKEYGQIESTMTHPSGTLLINASGYCIMEI